MPPTPPRVLVVGDVFVDILAGPLERLPMWGKDTYSPLPITAVPGGSAQNTATGLASLGIDTQLYSAVGCDVFADVVRQRLATRGVQFREATVVMTEGSSDNPHPNSCDDNASATNTLETTPTLTDNAPPTGTCIVLSGDSDRGFVSHYGVSDCWGLTDVTVDDLREFDHVHVGGYFSCRGMRATLVSFLQRCAVAGCTVSMDTNDDWTSEWDPTFVTRVLPLVDIYLPNDDEALAFASSAAKASGQHLDTSLDAALDFLARHVRGAVVCTCGAAGVRGRLAHTGASFTAPALRIDTIVDAVGCGDAFNAGFLSQYLATRPKTPRHDFNNVNTEGHDLEGGGGGHNLNHVNIARDAPEPTTSSDMHDQRASPRLSPASTACMHDGASLSVACLQQAAEVASVNASFQVLQRGAAETVGTSDRLVAFCQQQDVVWQPEWVRSPPRPSVRTQSDPKEATSFPGVANSWVGLIAFAVGLMVGVRISRL
eukprot:m.50914 g.50914  ORF g.50914 m.50914 type:complete len:485 (-) comp7271_c0_seq1:148-1602(-)